MGGGKRSASAPSSPQHMYFLEGGLLVVGNLLKTDVWVHDEVRTHCNVCVQQFLPFRRRHHCRTCGEVVCGGCSSQRKIRLTDVNVECATRVCTFCMIRATDASIKANETVMRETLAMDKRRMSILPVQSTHPAVGSRTQQQCAISPGNGGSQQQHPQAGNGRNPGMRQKQLSMWSMDSELTNGSVVQLWPQPIPDDESARLQVVRNSVIQRSDNDPTMNLLVSIVARTLECPVAFIGILDDSFLWFKASVGWDATYIPRDDCVCSQTLAQGKTMVVADTNLDKHFHANNLSIDTRPLRYYAGSPIRVMGRCIGAVCALDTTPHRETSSAMRSTLEAVANIVSEVLEQRVDRSSSIRGTESTMRSMNRTHTGTSTFLQVLPSETASDSCSDRSSSMSDGGGLLDLHASLQGLNLADYASSQGSSDDLEWTDPSPSMYLAMSAVPPEYGEKIGVSMEAFQRLQSTLWCERPSQDGIKTFELFRSGRHFTRANTKLSGTCAEAVAHLQNYENARIYNMFVHVTRRYKLGAQTWMDEIAFKPNGISAGREGLRVLTHLRQYPDGSTVVVAMNSNKIYEVDENDLLFGWFVAPCSLHDGLGSVNVSCIVAQSYYENNQLQDEHLGCDLLLRLRQCLTSTGKRPASPPPALASFDVGSITSTVTLGPAASAPSRLRNHSMYPDSLHDSGSSNQRLSYQDLVPAAAVPPPTYDSYAHYRQSESCFENQRHHEANASFFGITRSISEESFGSFASSATNTSTDTGCAKTVPIASRSNQLQASHLNQNERMMLDLLDKTISTQEILAAQQHEMANVIDYHGRQLQRISTAIERVETLLADSNEKLKRMPQPKAPRCPMC